MAKAHGYRMYSILLASTVLLACAHILISKVSPCSRWHGPTSRNSASVIAKLASPLPPPLQYNETMLDISSMWAVGADARQQMRRHANIPLVTWTDEARQMLASEWERIQGSSACNRVMVIYPYQWGITSQMRDYSDALLVALSTGRKLVFVKDAPRPKWCQGDAWLECFFQPLSNPSTCRFTTAQLNNVTVAASANLTAARSLLESDAPIVHFRPGTRFLFVLRDPTFFPDQLWASLVDARAVKALHEQGLPLDWSTLQHEQPSLYHLITLSALRTMIAPVAFQAQSDIIVRAQSRSKQLDIGRGNRCVALHLRWTDKKDDGGVASRMNFSVEHVPIALQRLEERTKLSYKCLLVLSDDEAAAIAALQRQLGDTYHIEPVSRIESLFKDSSTADLEDYSKKGHFYVRKYLAQDPAFVFAYYREVFVDILVAVYRAEYLIGVGSSGVSQYLAQSMGAVRRVDGNALAIWQEDVLEIL